MKIAVSYLSVNYDELKNCFLRLNNSNADYIHVDVMDGKFVSNKTLDADEIIPLLKLSNKPKDVHLMVNDVISYVNDYDKLDPEYITFHIETNVDINETINYIKNKGIKVGIAINPDTSISKILPLLNIIDLVLVMSVYPGKGGQSFIEESINKIDELVSLRKDNNYNYVIEVDGGIKDTNISKVNVDLAVSGSFITNSDDYNKQIDKLKTA